MSRCFDRFARACAWAAGTAGAFAVAVAAVLLWAVTGPLFGFSDTWQLVINTGTTILTFMMIFLVQHTQNRDTAALQAKLDEIVRALPGARDEVAGCEQEEPGR